MQISTGLPEQFRTQAAQLYWEAFSGKLGKILGHEQRVIPYFKSIIAADQAIIALSDDGEELLGLAGFDLGEGGFIGGGLKEIIKHYGYVGGLWRGVLLDVFTRKVKSETLQMDGITVSKNARGQGVGTALLVAIFEKARAEHIPYVELDVINTNPRAKALYKRMGFVEISANKIWPMSYLFGFSMSYKMQKTV